MCSVFVRKTQLVCECDVTRIVCAPPPFLTGGRSVTPTQLEAIHASALRIPCPDDMPSPHWHKVIVAERDVVLTHSLWRACDVVPPGGVVVAVVGRGHLGGIQAHWGKTSDESVAPLLAKPAGYAQQALTMPLAIVGSSVVAWKFLMTPPVRRGVLGLGAGVAAAVGVCAWNLNTLAHDVGQALRKAKAAP